MDQLLSENLLRDVLEIIRTYEKLNQKTGRNFNIFEIANMETNEVVLCRVLYELLSSSGQHGQGNKYLSTFISNVLNIKISDEELKSAKVYREYVIENNRRIDLFISMTNHKIPIEVKIYAEEQEKQCFDYYQKAENSDVYYLTRFGTKASEYSTCGKIKTNNISFQYDILNWLEKDVLKDNTLKLAPIREIIFQFVDVIRKFTNRVEREQDVEIVDMFLNSSDNMKAAISIKDNVDKARIKVMKKLFEMIEEKVKVEKLSDKGYDYADNNYVKCEMFYDRKGSTYPGISYMYKANITKPDNQKENVDIWVRLEIDDNIFVGYCCPENGDSNCKHLNDNMNIVRKLLKIEPNTDKKGWWVYSEDIIEKNVNASPKFKNHNDAYYQLLNEKYLEEFATTCADRIVELLKK